MLHGLATPLGGNTREHSESDQHKPFQGESANGERPSQSCAAQQCASTAARDERLEMPARVPRPIGARTSRIFSLPVNRRHDGAGRPDGPTTTPLPVVFDFGDFRRVPEVLIADG